MNERNADMFWVANLSILPVIIFCAFMGIIFGQAWWGSTFGDWFWQRWLFGLVMVFIPAMLLWFKSAQIVLDGNARYLGAVAKICILLSSAGLVSAILGVLGRYNWWPTYPILIFLVYVLSASILTLKTPQAAKAPKK